MVQYKSGIKRKNNILQVCRELFYEKGYKETTVRDIAKVLNIDPGTILYHFKSKDDLYKQIMADIYQKCHDEIRLYVKREDNKEYLAFMLFNYFLVYKCFKDKNFRRFVFADINLNYAGVKDYYQKYFNYFSLPVGKDEFIKKYEFELTSCYYVDLGIFQDFANNSEFYIKKYDIKNYSKHIFMIYARIFRVPDNTLDIMFYELEKLLTIVRWDELYLGL